MKIAFVYDAVYPWVRGGAERRIWEVARRLAQKHEVHVFGIQWWKGEQILRQHDITYHGVCKPLEFYVEGRRSIKEAIIFALAILKPLLAERFDIIDVSAFPYFPVFTSKLAASLHRTPLVVTWHEVWEDYWYEYLGRAGIAGRIVEALAIQASSQRIAVSQHTAARLPDAYIVPNGVDLSLIDSVDAAEQGFDVVFAGRLIREKQPDLLLRALTQVEDANCAIIREGPELERLKQLASELGVEHRVVFTGFLPYARVLSIFKASRIFASPSRREGFGMAALEAMACRLPVVTVSAPRNATVELLQHNNGIITAPDEHHIAEAITQLLTEEHLRYEMAGRARQVAEAYTWDEITRRAENTYTHLLHRHRNQARQQRPK